MGNKKTVSKKSVQKSQSSSRDASKLRSRQWFNNPKNPDMTALYIERYMNWGISQRGAPIG